MISRWYSESPYRDRALNMTALCRDPTLNVSVRYGHLNERLAVQVEILVHKNFGYKFLLPTEA